MYGVGHFLTRNATCFPDRKAIVFKDREFTYRELNTRVNRLANNLNSIGINKGDKVGFILYNCDQFVTLFFALQKIGAVAVPLNFRLLADEILRNLDYAECKALVYGADFSKVIPLSKETSLFLKNYIFIGDQDPPEGDLNFETLCTEGPDGEPQIIVEEKDWSCILYTSGSTGMPKGVVRTHRNARDYATMMAAENVSMKDDIDILLTHSPMFHTAGLGLLMKIMALGGTFITAHGVTGEDILEQIQQHRVTQLLLIPPVLYERLARVKDRDKYDLSSVQEVQTTGGKMSNAYLERIFEVFPNCLIKYSYGSTEVGSCTSTVMTRKQLESTPERFSTTGTISHFAEMRIVDEKGNDVRVGDVGEGLIRSTIVFEGYLKQPEKTAEVIKNGWYHSKDLFRMDDEGYYYLVDRIDDMIKTGGENVYPQEVERVLLQHPAIEECAVVGIPDHKYGQAVAVAIVMRGGMELSSDEMTEFCRIHIAGYKIPRYVAFVKALPTNSANKIQKKDLQEKAQDIFELIRD